MLKLVLKHIAVVIGTIVGSVVLLGAIAIVFFGSIARSHIVGNVPAPNNFHAYLRRDLMTYFRAGRDGRVSMSYELLRNGPTQAGVGYPEFYVWIRFREIGGSVQEGAVSVDAVEGKGFHVAHFLPAIEARSTGTCREVFPAPVCARIIEGYGRS